MNTPNTPAGGAVAAMLADAFECFWNAALGEARNHDSTTMAVAATMAEGMNAIARRLREHAEAEPPSTVSTDQVRALVNVLRGYQRIAEATPTEREQGKAAAYSEAAGLSAQLIGDTHA